MIDAGVEAERIDHVAAFVRPARDTDHAAARLLRELADHAAHRAARRAHHHRLARARRDDPVQAVPGGHARHADRAEIRGQRHVGRVDLAQPRARRGRVRLPAQHPDHPVADRETRMPRLDDLARRAALHHRVERLRLRVRLRVAHPAPHVRVQRQEVVAHAQLTVGERRVRCFDQPEVVDAGLALRTRHEQNLAIDLGHRGLLAGRRYATSRRAARRRSGPVARRGRCGCAGA